MEHNDKIKKAFWITEDIIMFIYISDLQFLCQEKNRSRSKNGKQYTET